MLHKLKQSRSEGFTIIEVMIVLAIAAMILLVVLLAVPALQRNSRNTAVKTDAGALAGALNDFSSNNNGATATGGKFSSSGVLDLTNATITTGSGATAKLQGGTEVNGVSSSGTVTFATAAPVAANVKAGSLFVVKGQSCIPGAGNPATSSSRAFAVYYWTEATKVPAGTDASSGIINGAGLKGQCLDQ